MAKIIEPVLAIHKPRSGDAYNEKFDVILMAARNRPMGSFINVKTDKVVGTIGENVDCELTDGTYLLDHADANTISGATKYQCEHSDYGGDQISGHPYWLTPDYAAIVDRTNRQISVYYVWEENDQLKSRLVNHLKTRTSVHQIIPRDRTSLPYNKQADFYAVEEGNRGGYDTYGIPNALIKMKLTPEGLELISRIDLARSKGRSSYVANTISRKCVEINRFYGEESGYPAWVRRGKYKNLFWWANLTPYKNQDSNVEFPVECLSAKVSGGHNADFAPDNKRLYVGSDRGYMHIINDDRWKIENTVNTGGISYGSKSVTAGSGHTCFAADRGLAIVTNHTAKYNTIIDLTTQRKIKNVKLPFANEGIFNANQSHTCYVDDAQDYYYNFWTDGGVFYKIDLYDLTLADSLYTGGIPIQGSYISLSNIQTVDPAEPLVENKDTASSAGEEITIDVLANDTGVDLSIGLYDTPNNGTAAVSNGMLVYTPNAGFTGTEDFWYEIRDPSGQTAWGNVVVTVDSGGAATLVANNDIAEVSKYGTVTIDVLANDEGTDIRLAYLDDTLTGSAKIVNNKIEYTADDQATDDLELWYGILDSNGNEEWAKVTITIH